MVFINSFIQFGIKFKKINTILALRVKKTE